MPTNNASLDHFLHRLQGQDAVIGTASGEIPVAVSIELTRLFTEINQLHPGLLAPFNANGNAVALKSQISTAASKLTALAASPPTTAASAQEQQLLAEVEDILRTMPPRATIRHNTDENLTWLGRAANFVEHWKPEKAALFREHEDRFHQRMANESMLGQRGIMTLLNQAQHDLRLRTRGPLNTMIAQGNVHDYFEELRKLIEPATDDLFFVDQYFDADFVPRYLPFVQPGTVIRLLTGTPPNKLARLLPAVDLFAQQHGCSIAVRSTDGIHGRYLFVDRTACYQSDASFKDGAKNAVTLLTQVVDGVPALLTTHETLWTGATVQR